MNTTHRAYKDTAGDFRLLCDFMINHNEAVRAYSTWCLGRVVDWRYGLWGRKADVPDFWDRNAQLWFDSFGGLAGFAISEEGDNGLAIITRAGFRFLYTEILQWALAEWGDRGPRAAVEVTARQELEMAVLERHGFQRQGDFSAQTFDLTRELPPPPPLAEGFTIVDMATHPNYRAQRILRDEAFHGRANLSEEALQRELLFRGYTRHGPIYHPQADLCVMAPDGRFVAGCEALIDPYNLEADIERVCTHSDFRRRGLARAVIHACMARLRAYGLHKAHIAGYSDAALRLYASLGESEETVFHIYEVGQDA